jgi:hypothetical protein
VVQEPDPPTFVVLPDEYEDGSEAGPVQLAAAGLRLPPRLELLLQDHRARWATAVLACVAIGALILVAAAGEHASLGTIRAAPPAVARAYVPAVPSGRPWPAAHAACGTERYLPIVNADLLRVPTRVRLAVGGQSVHTVDLDAGTVSTWESISLSEGQFVSQLVASGATTYALVQPCESTDTGSVFRITWDSGGLVLASNRHIEGLFADGRGGVWAAQVEDIATDGPITMVQLPGPGVVRLPVGLTPVAVTGHKLIATVQTQQASVEDLVSYDLRTHRLGPRLGRASSFTVSAGLLLWIEGRCSQAAPCALHRYELASGRSSARRYALPEQSWITGGVVSPDRTKLAFPLAWKYQDRRTDTLGFGPPFEVAVLDLGTGVLETIGGLELPPTTSPGLTFSARGDWLVIALNEGSSTEVLVWRLGLVRPLRAGVRIDSQMLQAPPVIALPR